MIWRRFLIQSNISKRFTLCYSDIAGFQYYAPKMLDKLKSEANGHIFIEPLIEVATQLIFIYPELVIVNAARCFLGKALKFIPEYSHPRFINTDKNPAYGKAIADLKNIL